MPDLWIQSENSWEADASTSGSSPIPTFDSRFIFPILCITSLAVFAIQTLVHLAFNSRAGQSPRLALDFTFKHGLVHRNGGWIALAWGAMRLTGILSLVGVQVLVISEGGEEWKVDWTELSAFVYLASLSLFTIIFPPSPLSALSRSLRPILVILLLSVALTYTWRDAAPLYAYDTLSLDPWKSQTIAKLGLIAFTSILPPLLSPRIFVPTSPDSVATDEETTSILSFILYFFVERQVLRAWNDPSSLSLENLPRLRSREEALYVRSMFMHWVDPADPRSKKSLLRGIARIWWKEAIAVELVSIVLGVSRFLPLLGTNRLLAYLQAPQDASIRPWIWAACIGLGPFITSVAAGLSSTLNLRFARQFESLMLQLLFEVSLRVRVNEAPSQAEGAKGSKKTSRMGKMISLISNDIGSVSSIRQVFNRYTDVGMSFVISSYALWRLLGWTSFVAMGLALLALPITNKAISYQRSLQKAFKSLTDVRVQRISEALVGLRITKALGLEEKVKEELEATRKDELEVSRRSRIVATLGSLPTSIIPILVTISTLGIFTKVQGGVLDAATVFTAMGLLGRFSGSIASLFRLRILLIEPTTALERMDEFLRGSPLIDRHSSGESTLAEESWIGFRHASFSWYKDLPEDSTLHNFRLEVDDLTFEKGKVTVVTGPTGSGKTSLLMALLGEMHFEKDPESICSLPRSEGISYVHQQSFVQNLTIRSNIVFGSPFDRERYEQVISACGLEADLAGFAAGDHTEVGEKGITLSGGQRSRLSLARAIYSSAKTVLVDDCFSSLDVQTSKWIVDKCFNSSLIKGRTVILVTHHLSLVAPITDFMVTIEDGRVVASGPVEKVLAAAAPDLIALDEKDLEQEDGLLADPSPDEKEPKSPAAEGRLAVEEEKVEGKVGIGTMSALVASFGSWFFWIPYLLLGLSADVAFPARMYVLSAWSRAYTRNEPGEVSTAKYLGLFSAIAISGVLINAVVGYIWTFGTFRSGRVIHQSLLNSVVSCTTRFLDITPQGRLLSRFTKDIRAIDTTLPRNTQNVIIASLWIVVQLATLISLVPIFALSIFVIAGLGYIVSALTLNAQRAVKRDQGILQGPVSSHFSEAMASIVSVRAFGAENHFREEGIKLVDPYMRNFAFRSALSRWSQARFNLLNALFSGALAGYLAFPSRDRDASKSGLILSVSISFATQIIGLIRDFNEWEVDLVSLERIQAYVEIEHEPAATPSGTPPASWPTSGSLVVQGLTARYSKEGPIVLDDVSFSLKSGQKCAVVGRTGSGKSTLAVSLLRLIPTEGTVVVDGLDTSKLNLQAIRSNITLIPQDPTLFSGDIRKNIDPYGITDDAALNDILRSIGLVKTVEEGEPTSASKPQLSLDSHVSAGGENLSQGTRQLVSFARGLVRRSKIFLFDECTASIDYETDALIQRTLRTELNDSTLITIAHRLLSIIDYDVILFLSDGKVVEFDSPSNLLKNSKGHFRALVEASSDKETLLSIVESRKQ